jgi:pimeloyl-ACP methyl ester carboxylesterase
VPAAVTALDPAVPIVVVWWILQSRIRENWVDAVGTLWRVRRVGLYPPHAAQWGSKERMYSARDAVRRLNCVSPRIKTEILPDAGHDLPFAQADMLNRRVLTFLQSC